MPFLLCLQVYDAAPMNARTWYRRLLFLHLLAFLLESSCVLGLLALVAVFFQKTFSLSPFGAFVFTGLGFSFALLWQLRFHWQSAELWRALEKRHPELQGRLGILEELLLKQGCLPDEALRELALEQSSAWLAPIRYPFKEKLFRSPLPWLVAFLFLLLGTVGEKSWQELCQKEHNRFSVRLEFPDYLKLPPLQLNENEEAIKIYAGTLFILELSPKLAKQKPRLKDQLGRLYLSSDGLHYRVRVMEKLELFLNTEEKKIHQWQLDNLEDQAPVANWNPQVAPSDDWRATMLRYEAQDDMELADSFVSVNGTELEYAGSSSGKKKYAYQWNFDPLEYLPLEGGNVALSVHVYDRDTVRGPKRGSTLPIIWRFAGVEAQTLKQLKALLALAGNVLKRQEALKEKPLTADNKLNKNLSDFAQLMPTNPVLDPVLTHLAQSMSRDYNSLTANLLRNKEPKAINQSQEQQSLKQDQAYLDHIKHELEKILKQLKAAELLKRMDQLAKKMERASSLDDAEKMSALSKDLKKHLEQSGASPKESSELMDQMSKAELASMLGDGKTASEMLKKLQEMLQEQSNKGTKGGEDSQLQKQFTELLQRLDDIISHQSSLNDDFLAFSAGQSESDKALQASINKLLASTQSKLRGQESYQQALNNQHRYEKLRRTPTQQKSSEDKAFLDDYTATKGKAETGREIMKVHQHLQDLLNLSRSTGVLSVINHMSTQWLNTRFLKQLSLDNETQQKFRELILTLNKANDILLKDRQDFNTRQDINAQDGESFAQDFYAYRPFFSSSMPFSIASSASRLTRQSAIELRAGMAESFSTMSGALQEWKNLKDILDQAMQNSSASGGMNGSKSSRGLQICKDGSLMFKKESGHSGSKEGDGKNSNTKGVEVPLPEEFQKAADVEKRLQKELKQMQDGPDKERFRRYMLDLLR